jgi:serine/threonine protein phosphatase PrpC
MIVFSGLSNPGCERENNEDRIWLDPRGRAFVVADGMGGEAGGETASFLATQAIANHLREVTSNGSATLPDSDDELTPNQHHVVAAIQLANRRILEESARDKELQGMGSTVALVYVDESTATIGWVGDSRAYLFRSNILSQLTRDDSMVAELLDAGAINH